MTPPEGKERQELAENWVRVATEICTLTSSNITNKTFFQRIGERVTAHRSEVRTQELHRELHSIKQHMEYLFLGADPHKWDVLSGGRFGSQGMGSGSFILEDTLKDLTWTDEITTETMSQARHILVALPKARAQAELGHDDAVTNIGTRLLALSENPDLGQRQRRQLLEHLPAHLRPIPESLSSLERGQYPVTLFIRLKGPNDPHSYAETPGIELEDIVVARWLRGKGLGTAALSELCRYADIHGLPIRGILEPGPDEPSETVATVARWYARMDFTQGDREPHQWRRGHTIRRSPRRSAPAID